MKLDRQTRLERVRGLRLSIGDDNEVWAEISGVAQPLGPHALALLDAFARPRSLEHALVSLGVAGAQDWMDLASSALRLVQAGVLRPAATGAGGEAPRVSAQASGYEAWPIHAAMLGDRARTAGFLAGVAEVVRPGDVVIDIGTGTGVLAIAAAKAGASRVYALEASGIAELARAVIAANGCADRVTVVEGLSTRLTLPERADVLVSEMIGNDPLGERVLELTADARRRLLVPGARFVPARVRVCALAVEVSAEELARRLGSEATVRDWRAWYGIDFSPVAEAARASNEPLFYLEPQRARGWRALHRGVVLAELDFERETPLALERAVELEISAEGELSGVLIYFELDLGPTTSLSSHPAVADERNHWRSPVWVPREPLAVRAGERLRLRYQYGLERRRSRLAIERV